MTILQRLLHFTFAATALLVACFLGYMITINRLYMAPIENLSKRIEVDDRYDDAAAMLDGYADERQRRVWFGYGLVYQKQKDSIYIGYGNGFDGSNLIIAFGNDGTVTENRYFRD